jgi:hypothetical protein
MRERPHIRQMILRLGLRPYIVSGKWDGYTVVDDGSGKPLGVVRPERVSPSGGGPPAGYARRRPEDPDAEDGCRGTVGTSEARGMKGDLDVTIPSVDFISTYTAYADVLEAPAIVHEAVAISLLAAAWNPRVGIQYGALSPTLDVWTLLLSGSGFGRNTLISLAYPVHPEAPKTGSQTGFDSRQAPGRSRRNQRAG